MRQSRFFSVILNYGSERVQEPDAMGRIHQCMYSPLNRHPTQKFRISSFAFHPLLCKGGLGWIYRSAAPFPSPRTPLYFSRVKKQSLASRLKNEINVYRRVISHPRCPRFARICLGAAVAYALSPIDIIPDFIPVLGYLDDAIILPVLVFVALRSLPEGLVDEVRAEMMSEHKSE